MNKILILLSMIACFSLNADICLNGWLNKYRHGDDYKYFTKTKTSFLGGLFSWETTTFNTQRNMLLDKKADSIFQYAEKHLPGDITKLPEMYDGYLQQTGFISSPDYYKSQEYTDFIDRYFQSQNSNTSISFMRNKEKDKKQGPNIANYHTYLEFQGKLPQDITQFLQIYDNDILKKNVNDKYVTEDENGLPTQYATFAKKLKDHLAGIKYVKVSKQTGSTCGFHAVKNAIDLLNGKKTTAEEFNHLQEWQNKINKNDDLDEQDIKNLADYTNMDPKSYTIIPNIREFQPQAFCSGSNEEDADKQFETLCTAIEALRQKKPTKHAFILGNMCHIGGEGKQEGSYGHWITILAAVNEQGEQELHCADSFYDKVDSKIIQALQNLLKQDPDQLKMKKDLECFLEDTTDTNISIETKIRNCTNLLNIAENKGYTSNQKFSNYIKSIQKTLATILKNNRDSLLPEDIQNIANVIRRLPVFHNNIRDPLKKVPVNLKGILNTYAFILKINRSAENIQSDQFQKFIKQIKENLCTIQTLSAYLDDKDKETIKYLTERIQSLIKDGNNG